jgi:hypothetical protein
MDDHSHIIKDWAIVTVPRVGSHYLQERIFAHTGKLIVKYHEPQLQTWGYTIKGLFKSNIRFWSGLEVDKLKLITIVRDPKDLLISHVALAARQRHDGFIIDEETPLNVDNIISLAEKYCDHYLKLEKSSTIIIDYNQLISSPFEVTTAIAHQLGIDIITDKYQSKLVDFDDYFVSSKQLPEYDYSKNVISHIDLSDFYNAYNKILSKSIKL